MTGLLSISPALITGYGPHETRIDSPLLPLSLFRIRTFSAAVSGNFFTRLGIGGVPFLLLLYQLKPRIYGDSSRPAHYTPGNCRHARKISPVLTSARHKDIRFMRLLEDGIYVSNEW
jgi:hypothetical protein